MPGLRAALEAVQVGEAQPALGRAGPDPGPGRAGPRPGPRPKPGLGHLILKIHVFKILIQKNSKFTKNLRLTTKIIVRL